MQETIAFAELLKELERPDPVRPEAQEMQETAAGPAEEPETAPGVWNGSGSEQIGSGF